MKKSRNPIAPHLKYFKPKVIPNKKKDHRMSKKDLRHQAIENLMRNKHFVGMGGIGAIKDDKEREEIIKLEMRAIEQGSRGQYDED